MKKYMKQLALSVLALCMIFTLATGNVVNAADNVGSGEEITIYYRGVNLNPRYDDIERSASSSKFTFDGKNQLLLSPAANPTSYDTSMSGALWGLISGSIKNDGYGNSYYDFYTTQRRNVNGKMVEYRLVGFKNIDTGANSVEKYLAEYSFPTESEALEHVDYTLNDLLDLNEFNKIKNHIYGDVKDVPMCCIYTTEKEKKTYGEGTYDYKSNGKSDWDAPRRTIEETTNGISTQVNFDKKEITVTIPEDFDGENIQLKLDDELVNLFTLRFLSTGGEIIDELNKPGWDKNNPYVNIEPGDRVNFKINIINNSKYDYGYAKDSLKITTPDLNSYKVAGYANETSTEMYGFDGQRLLDKFTPKRIENEALRALLGEKNEDGVFDISENSIKNALDGLKWKDNEKLGVDNLHKYYIDYYNDKFGSSGDSYETKTKIEEFSKDQIRDMFIDSFQSNWIEETNKEVGETLYNYFYNAVLGVAPAEFMPKPGVEGSGNSRINQEYTVGNFMRNESNVDFEKYMTKTIGVISNDSEGSANWGFHIDGEYCFNIYNFIDYGFEMGFKLEKKVGDVTVDKHIELGGFDKNNTPTFMFKLTDVNGNTYFKTISFNEGETDKQVIFKDIPYGQYTVEEVDSIRYEVVGDIIKEGTLSDETVDEHMNVTVHYENTKSKDNDFSDTNLVINSFKKGDNSIEISKKEHNNGKRG